MSINDLTATVTELKELKTMQDELADEIAALEDRIKQHMTENDIDTVYAADCLPCYVEGGYFCAYRYGCHQARNARPGGPVYPRYDSPQILY